MSLNGGIIEEAGVLREWYVSQDSAGGAGQAIRAVTRVGPFGVGADVEQVRANLAGLREDALADFLAKNAHPCPISPDLVWDARLHCLDEGALQELFRDNQGWDRLRDRFPESSGLLEVSRVGLSRDGTQALFYTGFTIDALGGSGHYWLFAREDGRWVEVARDLAWIS